MAAAVKGYTCTVVMPMKMSREKVDALRLLGAKIVRTPTSAAFNELDGLIRVAHKLHLEDPENTIILDQVKIIGKICLPLERRFLCTKKYQSTPYNIMQLKT